MTHITKAFTMHAPEEDSCHKINILITEDHPLIRQRIRHILEETEESGLIEEASSGQEMMVKISEHDFDVILLDISLPGKSGLELLKDLKKTNPKIKVLIVSIYPAEQYGLRAMKLGASGYLTKSNVPDELVKAIRKVMAGENYFNVNHNISDTLN